MENQNQNWQDLMTINPDEEISLAVEPNEEKPAVADEAIEKELEAETATVALPAAKLEIALKLVAKLEAEIKEVKELLSGAMPAEAGRLRFTAAPTQSQDSGGGRVVEGVFDGEKMIGADGEIYTVPANYASKSKLVEGDIMKLTVTSNGMFIFKQISPIERQRVTGTLAQDEEDNYWVEANGKHWRILTASATYFKGEPGDEATILVPKGAPSRWAAVEYIVKNRPLISQ